MLAKLWSHTDRAAMWAWARQQPLDLLPATDDRPFFFNMLKPSTWLAKGDNVDAMDVSFLGNLQATKTLVWATLVSLLLAVGAVVGPLWGRRRDLRGLPRAGTVAACVYFALIGIGFMFVEIGLLSRLGVMLGHPTLALVVLLGGIICFTGLGSFASERIPIDRTWVARAYPLIPLALVVGGAAASALAPAAYAPSPAGTRIMVALTMVAIPGLGLGLGFPLGLRLAGRLDDDRPQRPVLGPWLWGINGACGVVASGLALGSSMIWGIGTTLMIGAACYGLLLPCTWVLSRPSPAGS